MTIAIRCEQLKMTYPGRPPVRAVRGIDLSIESGECFGVLGPNGAGKTTTIEIIEGLLRPTEGHVEIMGMSWAQHEYRIRQLIGISLQETKLSEKLTVLETLTLFRSFYDRGITPEAAIARVSLEDKSRAWVKTLSGGQQQRLALACALVGDPDLLFLDEPTTGLDPQSRRQLWDIISELRRLGRTILLTTHYMEEAERLCDRVAIFDEGQVISQGTPEELIAGLGGDHMIEFTVEGDGHGEDYAESLGDLPTVSHSAWQNGRIVLSVKQPHVVLPALWQKLAETGARLGALSIRHASLDDVFVQLAGRHLQEDAAGQAPGAVVDGETR